MMETRKEIAAEKKRCGSHNCTQAVVCTYYDYTGMVKRHLEMWAMPLRQEWVIWKEPAVP